ncbi:hypothetical protein D2E27_06660 [Mycobacteroides abscessus]|nr:hypothetical protein D2E27_06660 [Mycobacteroides abscessus]RIS07869.1 hypothetical protein D2E58_03910 [Mycobacteroides abscessus]
MPPPQPSSPDVVRRRWRAGNNADQRIRRHGGAPRRCIAGHLAPSARHTVVEGELCRTRLSVPILDARCVRRETRQ